MPETVVGHSCRLEAVVWPYGHGDGRGAASGERREEGARNILTSIPGLSRGGGGALGRLVAVGDLHVHALVRPLVVVFLLSLLR